LVFTKCGTEKQDKYFWQDKQFKNGLQRNCKVCAAAQFEKVAEYTRYENLLWELYDK